MLRRWTAPIHEVRRRILSIVGYACLLPGGLIPAAVVVLWLVISLWPEPKIALAWDVARETLVEPFDPARCVHLERVQRCIYQGDITLSIRLPEGCTLMEKATLVWVDVEGNRPASITIYSVRYDVEDIYTKLEAYIAAWRLNRQLFEAWQRATRAGETEASGSMSGLSGVPHPVVFIPAAMPLIVASTARSTA